MRMRIWGTVMWGCMATGGALNLVGLIDHTCLGNVFAFSSSRQESCSLWKRKWGRNWGDSMQKARCCLFPSVQLICHLMCSWSFAKLHVVFCHFFCNFMRLSQKNLLVFGRTIMMVLLWPGSRAFVERVNCTLPASSDQVSTVPPAESPSGPAAWQSLRD